MFSNSIPDRKVKEIMIQKFVVKQFVGLIDQLIALIDSGKHIEEIRIELVKLKTLYIDKFNLYEK